MTQPFDRMHDVRMRGRGMYCCIEPLEQRTLLTAGEPDPTFGGGDGLAVIDTDWPDEVARRVLVQADGRIVVGGSYLRWRQGPIYGDPTDDAALARFNADGSIDGSFGEGGVERLEWNHDEYGSHVTSMATVADGQLVIAAYSHGWALVKSDEHRAEYDDWGFVPNASSVGVDRDGGLLVTGLYGKRRLPHVAWLDSRFEVDPEWAKRGLRRLDFSRQINAPDAEHRFSHVVVQPDGKILVGGLLRKRGARTAPTYFAVMRLDRNGSLDRGYGDRGRITVKLPGLSTDYEMAGMVRQSDGMIILAATTPIGNRGMLLRLQRDGRVDRKYGRDGLVRRSNQIASIALHSDDKLLVGMGQTIWRYDGAGKRDRSFGPRGEVGFAGGHVTDLAVQPDGKIVASVRTSDGYAVVRLLGG